MLEKEIKGLNDNEVKELQEKFGKNEITAQKKESFFHKLLEVISEPMFLLLIIAAVIYFILGEPRDGAIMLIFVLGIISIEVIQEWKTDKTLKALKDLSAPKVEILRNNTRQTINSSDLLPGDIMYICEGVKVPADGIVLKASTLRIDESSLTGESEGVWKIVSDDKNENTEYWRKDYCYAGTLVTQGTGVILVDKIGILTEYGKIGKDVISAPVNPTPLQKQTGSLVKFCAAIAAILFIFVAIVTYLNISDHAFNDRIIESILSGVTLAMAMIPEEFPVILTVFLSMGAWRLAKKHSLVRKLPAVETLGAVSVLCVDKTGTITMNKMEVQDTWSIENNNIELIKTMGKGCKSDAYDPMEKAMIEHCEKNEMSKNVLFGNVLAKEYAFTDENKIMGNVWKNDNSYELSAKGSPEHLLKICDVSAEVKLEIEKRILEMSSRGLRVIAVGKTNINTLEEIKENLLDFKLSFCGIIGLADPPRESIAENIKICTNAGIRVVMITGDNGITASSIAKQVNMPNNDVIITGDELNSMTDEELSKHIKNVSIFSRVVPEHKMRIVKAFQANDEIVAMTGDGVNDAPALKYADIGIAMGKRGSEVSREAADIILLDDNFSTIVDTIKDGRRIYDNIRKAVGYVFSIHIPIAFASLFAPLFGINPAYLLLLPIHVVLLELVIDPTCSIVLERQPAEKDIMNRKPRDPNEKLLKISTLFKSVLQGLIIFIASFGTYLTFLNEYPNSTELARTMGLIILLLANIFLVHVNSSNIEYAFKSSLKLIKDRVMWYITLGTILGILVILYTPLNGFLKLTSLNFEQISFAVAISFTSVFWYEIVKIFKNIKLTKNMRKEI